MAKQRNNSVKAKTKGKAGITSGKVMLFVGTGIAGGLLFFAAKHFLKGNTDDSSDETSTTPEIKTASLSPSKTITSGRNDNFPLQNGSLGNRVRQLQQALSNIMGSEELNKYTPIDGDFRNGTQGALASAGYPVVLDQTAFEKLLSDSKIAGVRSGIATALKQIKTMKGKPVLSGFHNKELCTIKDTHILDKYGNRVIVKKNTALGKEMDSSNGMSYFKTKQNSIYAVPSQDVKYR